MHSNSKGNILYTTNTSLASVPMDLVYSISSGVLQSRPRVSCDNWWMRELSPIYRAASSPEDYALKVMTHQLLQGNLGTSMLPLET